MKEIMTAWVAGLFEGEGSFCFHKNIPKSLSITSTDLDVLEKVKNNFGGNIYKENRSTKKAHWKDAYVWHLSLNKIPEFFEMIKPFLGKRRISRGEEFITLYNEKIRKREEKIRKVHLLKKKVFELRENGLKHREISKELGIDRTYVTKILNGV